jgi:hypothetical protein
VLKGPIGTQYTVIATNDRKKMIVTQSENIHTFLSTRLSEKIFLLNFGEASPREVGKGISPSLHLEDNWISYFDPYQRIIHFEHTTNSALKFSLKLNNKINPYFIPQVVMVDESTLYYTDISDNGNYGLIEYKRNIDKSELIFKATSITQRLEINKCNDNFILSELPMPFTNENTTISFLKINNVKNITNREKAYSSDLNDLGHITCDYVTGSIYFIKNTGKEKLSYFDIASLNLNTKKLDVLTDLKTITTIINMDGLIISFDRGKYLIIKGNDTDFKNIDSLKKVVPNKEPTSEIKKAE